MVLILVTCGLQLDWTPGTTAQQNNLQIHRDSYKYSETTVGKLSKRSIQWCHIYYYIIVFVELWCVTS